jgi:hypothetical protein
VFVDKVKSVSFFRIPTPFTEAENSVVVIVVVAVVAADAEYSSSF